jgi:hypothetical protein
MAPRRTQTKRGVALLLGLLLSPVTFAGALYINGVRADAVRDMELKDVNIRVDGDGNVWIDAPRYSVEVLQPGGQTAPAAPQAPTAPPAPMPPVVAPTPITAPVAAPMAPAAVSGAEVAAGTWWLVTEDNQSTGHTIDVYISGVLVKTIKSGDEAVLMDISRYVRRGQNEVLISARAGASLGGGLLKVYLGQGSNDAGTLNLASPQITFTRRSSDSLDGASRQYTLIVP